MSEPKKKPRKKHKAVKLDRYGLRILCHHAAGYSWVESENYARATLGNSPLGHAL